MMGKIASYSIAALVSLSIHAVAIVALLINWQPDSKRTVVQPQFIQAELVQLVAEKKSVEKQKSKSVADAKAKQRALQKRRKAEQQRAEQKIREQQRQARLKAEQLKAQQQARKVQEEQQRLAEIERQRRQAEMADKRRAEQALITAKEDKKTAGSYLQLIRKRLTQHWSRPPSARRGMETLIELRLVPTGRIVGVKILKSSDDLAFDRSVEQAAYKAAPFEELRNIEPRIFEQYFRTVEVIFNPEDLRL